MTTTSLGGKEKAAVLLIALGPEASANVLRHLRDSEIEQLTERIFALEAVGDEVRRDVLLECFQMALASRYISSGGFDYAREMLSRGLGEDKARAIIERLGSNGPPRPFAFLDEADPAQLATFLLDEQPQAVALVLAHLPPDQSSRVLAHLPTELQADVAMRIATLGRAAPDVIEGVERILRQRLASVVASDHAAAGGVENLVKILANVTVATERAILDQLEREDPELAAAVRKQRFTFADLVRLDDQSLQRLLREVDTRDLARALRGTSEELRQTFFRNLSSRAGEMLRDEMQVGGALRAHQVEESRATILDAVRRLEEAGEIVLERGEGELV